MVEKRARVTVIGSYAVGMTMSCRRFPTEGETVKGYGFQMLHGGKGSNQAIAVARLGGDCVFGSAVGRDDFGSAALEMLRSERVDIGHVKVSGEAPTGVGLVIVSEAGNNEIVIGLGANDFISPADIDAMEDAIAGSDLLLVQLEVNCEAVVRAIEIAHRRGIPAILNPAPFQALPDEVVRKVAYITPNETEAAGMLCLEPGRRLEGEELARLLFDKYGVSVIVTLGEGGAYIKSRELDELVPTYRVVAVDSTGAGDTFSGALAVALGEGVGLHDAVRFANRAASISVTIEGVVPSIPFRKTVEASL
jgi:ribokinase